MEDRVDVAVVGAGPAGSAAACTAARAGLRVALVDRAEFPRDKLCGGGVTGRAVTELRRAFGLEVTPDLFLSTPLVRFNAGARVLGRMEDAPPLHMTMRRGFDARLYAEAVAAGAWPLARARPTEIDTDRHQLRLSCGRRLHYGVLIGADGVNSTVGRHLFGRAHDPATIGFALEVEAPAKSEPWVEIDFAAAPWGYGWAFPKAGSLTLGVGGLYRHNPDLRPRLAAYLRRHRADPDRLTVRGHFLPAGDFHPVPGRGAVLLVGDAAGLVDPMTGEGIGHAIASGRMAAEAAVAALDRGRPEAALSLYTRALASLQGELAYARRLQALVFAPLTHRAMLAVIAARPSVQRRALCLLAGEIDYADLRRGFLRRLAAHATATALHPLQRRAG